ncbi:MAG: DUF2282 domain-containing protein [Alphaproteobacteria bacterium]|nr:MAG: DUF2282 domain-containing protein [Alphaproteobacteria bacterium]
MKKHVFTATALAAVLSMAVATAANAADEAAAKNDKCFGVAKAGKNDCKTAAHACAGQSKADGGAEWVNVPAGLCDKLVGGSTTEPAAAEAPKTEEKPK